MSQNNPLIIIGGNSLVASYLIRRLVAGGVQGEVISRRPLIEAEGLTMTQMDLSLARNWIAPESATVISLLPLWVLGQLLPRFMGIRSIIAVGSTSRFSKILSQNLKERSVAAHLELAEDSILRWAEKSNVKFTLLRPTMIYDGLNDLNIVKMAKFIRRFHYLPLAAPAMGLRQPIHADDVAKALFNTINNAAAENKAFNIAGGEIIPYHVMAERVFVALKKKPRIIMLPTELLRKACSIASRIGVLHENYFTASVFQRMNEDLVFDTDEGLKLLQYKPRKFEPEFSQLK